ncbi:MAG: efflux RND transporter permease subunit, partial [Pedobacter sp.]
MNKLIKSIINFSLKNKYFIFFSTFVLILAGYLSFKSTTIDAFPDVTNTNITIITQWPGRSAEEVEKFVSRPLEIAMNPTEKRTSIRSSSLFGLSIVKVSFEDDVDYAAARVQVNNHLEDADLPDGLQPEVQPPYGPTGEIFRYTLSSDLKTVRELKTLQDWVIQRELLSVAGIADVVSFGGEVKSYQITVDPQKAIQYGVSATELFEAVS